MKHVAGQHKFWIIVCLILTVPALIINLGLNPFIEDEAIRATVALEMMYSGNFVTPTINGEFYYYKPPLYNWILIGFYHLLGTASEWTSRIPTVIFVYMSALFLYAFHRKEGFPMKYAFLPALMYLTCGRIMFWDSFLGLIDVFYSMVMYGMMVYIYLDIKAERYGPLYIRSYFLAAIGFMLKGYPTFLFLGLTLLLALFLAKKARQLFHPAHVMGVLIMGGIIGGYYLVYSNQNDVTATIGPLLDQATRRTGIKYDMWDVVVHLFTYPFENIYHFLPWSLMVILLVRRNFFTLLDKHPFVRFSFWAFLINILVYWVSPEVYPRYILMLVPLIFTVFIQFFLEEKETPTWRIKALEITYKIIIVLVPGFLLFSLLTQDLFVVTYLPIKGVVMFFLLVWLAISYFRHETSRIFILVAVVLCIRIGFNFFVVPVRAAGNIASDTKQQAIEMAQKYGEGGISMYKESVIDFTSTFYMERELGYILERQEDTPFEIFDKRLYTFPEGYEVVDSFMIRRDERVLEVMRKVR
jgi:4-amino-4-deoxy-L-arabinose transferase-like glycosyltransferase